MSRLATVIVWSFLSVNSVTPPAVLVAFSGMSFVFITIALFCELTRMISSFSDTKNAATIGDAAEYAATSFFRGVFVS